MRTIVEFIFPGRLHRLAYFSRGVVLEIVAGILYAGSTTSNPRFWWPALIILMIYGLIFVVLPRIHDAGMSRWWLLAMLFPVANIVFGILLLFRAPAFLTHPGPGEGTALDDPAPVNSGAPSEPQTFFLRQCGHFQLHFSSGSIAP